MLQLKLWHVKLSNPLTPEKNTFIPKSVILSKLQNFGDFRGVSFHNASVQDFVEKYHWNAKYRLIKKKYKCLFERKIHNKRGILKLKHFLITSELT